MDSTPQKPVPSGIRDNADYGAVGDFLKSTIQPKDTLAVVSAYFTIYAYAALQEQLEGIKQLRFLFGEPRFVQTLDPDKTDAKAFNIEDGGLRLANRLQQRRVARECANWLAAKAEIRSVKRPGFLHGKLYHITHASGEVEAILGSSNFTVSGLGLRPTPQNNNVELNLVVEDGRDLRALRGWFNKLWENTDLVEDVKAEVLTYLAQLYQDHAPEFIYYKTLYHLFEAELGLPNQSALEAVQKQVVETDIWQALFDFQKDGVRGAINKLMTYNGCILADSVGLGKTFEALAVIKFFELRGERVLVLCPKKLRENWTVYQAHNNNALNPFGRDRFGYTVLSHTDLSREGGYTGDINLATFNWGNYDLVVIDESHNFRNNTPAKTPARPSRYQRLMDDIIKSGVNTKVLLLSATPVNNSLRDLRNQIFFITGGEDATFAQSLGLPSLTETLAVAQRTFTEWAAAAGPRTTTTLLERLPAAFFKLLDGLTIARSRRHIERYYAATVTALGGFPVRARPLAVYPDIDTQGEFLPYDQLNEEIARYRLALFNPSRYVRPEFRHIYETETVVGFSQALREKSLIGMMKVNFLKRLESSVHAFGLTLARTVQKMDDLLARLDRFDDLPPDDLPPEAEDDDDLATAFEVTRARIQLQHLDVAAWQADLRQDRAQLDGLRALAQAVTPARDAKLAELQRLIEAKVRAPTLDKLGQPNRKVLVFTAFADTAHYLYAQLADWARHTLGVHVAVVAGGGRGNQTSFGSNDFSHILTHFAPRARRRAQTHLPQTAEIDLLIATDCISEGQNLQDCDYLINYDIHWNPVRVIQRFGRIDRIGSVNAAVHLVNFWPTADLDKYIALKTRVEARMALVDVTATQEDNVLSSEEQVVDELKHRDRQLRRLRDEVLDLEDFDEAVSLTDFTLDDFRADLNRFLEANRQRLHEAPLGLYALVPPDPALPLARPGALFCLRHVAAAPVGPAQALNPRYPFFLVYIQAEGVVRLSFAQPKQVLELWRALSAGQTAPHAALGRAFDAETQHGAEMSRYDALLTHALRAIETGMRRRTTHHLLTNRQAALPTLTEQVHADSAFELVTWLVIHDGMTG